MCPMCTQEIKKPFKLFCSIPCGEKFNKLKQVETKAAKMEKNLLEIIKYNIILKETLGIYSLRDFRKEIKRNLTNERMAYRYGLNGRQRIDYGSS